MADVLAWLELWSPGARVGFVIAALGALVYVGGMIAMISVLVADVARSARRRRPAAWSLRA